MNLKGFGNIFTFLKLFQYANNVHFIAQINHTLHENTYNY